MAIIDPSQNPHPLTNHNKIVTGDYVGGPYDCAKFGAKLSMGLLSKLVKYNETFGLFIPFLWKLAYRSDPSTDFHACWLKWRRLAQASLILLPILGVKSSKNPNFGGINRRFQAKWLYIIETTASISTQSFTDHQAVTVDGPNTRPTNPRWRRAAILKT